MGGNGASNRRNSNCCVEIQVSATNQRATDVSRRTTSCQTDRRQIRTDGGELKTVTLESDGVELSVHDGVQVGAALRNIAFLNGCTKKQAQKIHREHVEFRFEDGNWQLHVIGSNPTAVNGESLSKGDVVDISDGDTLTLAGVLDVEITLN